MISQTFPKGPRYPRLARVSKVSLLVVLLWLSLGGGVVMLLQGRAIGVALLMFGIAILAGFRSRTIVRFFEAESQSASLPARTLLAHLVILLLSAPFTIVLLGELPFYMMHPSLQRGLVFGGMASLTAAGGLIANLVALRRDRAERSLQ